MTPSQYEPTPWPVSEPTELDGDAYAEALANVDSPYVSNILGRLGNITTSRVLVWLLFLGSSYDAEGGIMKGYYIRAVARNRRAMDQNLRDLASPITFAFARNPLGQLTLSVRMIPLAPNELRQKVVGWGFGEL